MYLGRRCRPCDAWKEESGSYKCEWWHQRVKAIRLINGPGNGTIRRWRNLWTKKSTCMEDGVKLSPLSIHQPIWIWIYEYCFLSSLHFYLWKIHITLRSTHHQIRPTSPHSHRRSTWRRCDEMRWDEWEQGKIVFSLTCSFQDETMHAFGTYNTRTVPHPATFSYPTAQQQFLTYFFNFFLSISIH